MSAKVKVPTQLRSLTDGASEVQATGAKMSELIDDLETRHPGMRERMLDDDGRLRRFVNIYLDDEDIRFLQGLDTEVPEGAEVSIIPAVAGGSPSYGLQRGINVQRVRDFAPRPEHVTARGDQEDGRDCSDVETSRELGLLDRVYRSYFGKTGSAPGGVSDDS
jgi:molybdopterin converting factor small subunit